MNIILNGWIRTLALLGIACIAVFLASESLSYLEKDRELEIRKFCYGQTTFEDDAKTIYYDMSFAPVTINYQTCVEAMNR